MVGVTLLLYRHDLLGLPMYLLGQWLTVFAAGLTLISMGLYLRARMAASVGLGLSLHRG